MIKCCIKRILLYLVRCEFLLKIQVSSNAAPWQLVSSYHYSKDCNAFTFRVKQTYKSGKWMTDPEGEGTMILWNFSLAKAVQQRREQELSCFRILSTLHVGIPLSFLLYSHFHCLISVITVEPMTSQAFLQQHKICSCIHTVLT